MILATLITDGELGIKLYSHNSYDLIITDLYMPQMDGVHLINRIKTEFNSPKMIAVTGAFQTVGWNIF